MKTNLTIKNFRIFDAEGVEFKLEPITFLTGCNSSGKSSMVKAILFLQSFLKQIAEDYKAGKTIRLDEYKVDFSTYPLNALGGYSKVVNRKSDSNIITLEYTIYSKMLSHDVTVQMSFDSHESDDLNNAYLTTLQVILEGATIFSTGVDQETVCNLNPIKTRAKEFIIIEDLLNIGDIYRNTGGRFEEYKLSEKELNRFDEDRVNDVFDSRHYGKRTARAIKDIEWQLANESLFHLDLLEHCENMSKSETIDFLESCTYSSDFEKGALHRIIFLFSISNCETLKSFWLTYERKYLESQERIGEYAYHMIGTPTRLTAHVNLTIPQPYNNGRDGSVEFGKYVAPFTHIEEKISIKDGDVWFMISEDADEHKRHDEIMATADYMLTNPERPDFKFLYSVLTDVDFDLRQYHTDDWEENNDWGGKTTGTTCYYFKSKYQTEYDGFYSHYMLEAIEEFVNRMLMEVLTPDWVDNFSYISSSRVDVQRLYILDKQDDFTKLLKAYFEAKKQYKSYTLFQGRKIDKYAPGTFIQKWSKLLGIGDDIRVEVVVDGLGAQIKVVDSDNPEGQLLSYEGYGLTQIMSILLQIETTILSKQQGNTTTIAIEEPEIHLHPRLQSLLADMFLEAYQEYGIHFIVETHSEYLIRKSQLLVAKMNFESNTEAEEKSPFRTYYVSKDSKPYSLGYRKDGKFANDFGPGFYDEAASLMFQIL